MRPLCVVLILSATSAAAQLTTVRGKVTYLAADQVYTSLGRERGLQDSTRQFVVSRGDTIAELVTVALSSRSSACTIVWSRSKVLVGAEVGAVVPARSTPAEPSAMTSPRTSAFLTGPERARRPTEGQRPEGPVDIHGRASLQYYSTVYSDSRYKIVQPGVVVSARGALRNTPLAFEVYGNVRTSTMGGAPLFSAGSRNQSRVYSLFVEYDDGTQRIALGRVTGVASPSISLIDGVLVSRRIMNVDVGAAAGYQPGPALLEPSRDHRKVVVFGRYRAPYPLKLAVWGAYARLYHHATLNREVASANLSLLASATTSVYGAAEVDFRERKRDTFVRGVALASASVHAWFRIGDALNAGLGVNAARRPSVFSADRLVPDSLLDRELRVGATVTAGIEVLRGISIHNLYAPRFTKSRFGKEYSNTSSVWFNNLLSTGISVRTSASISENRYARARGVGAIIQRSVLDFLDLTVRYNLDRYDLRMGGDPQLRTSAGGDVIILIAQGLSLTCTYERFQVEGSQWDSAFSELSWRF